MKWGLLAALVMYLIPFWDWIPTVVAHRYYCANEAGFTVYKTLEQWKAENPGVAETLVATKGAPSKRTGTQDNYTDTYFLNQRFNWVVQKLGKSMNLWRHEKTVVDASNNDILARSIDFSSGYGNPMLGGRDWRVIKFWLSQDHCSKGKIYEGELRNFKNAAQDLGELK